MGNFQLHSVALWKILGPGNTPPPKLHLPSCHVAEAKLIVLLLLFG